jgi:ectoine hydroxylase-related dioxygenase (phytanoyl-CoA dioxygenase family)
MEEKFANETEKHVSQLKTEGWCVIEGVIPEAEVDAIREAVETSEAEYQKFSQEHGRWARNVIAFMPSFAKHLAQSRLLDVVKELLGPQVRISQTEYKIRPPHYELARAYHSDFPYDLKQKWHIKQPFPKAVIGLTTLWMLSPFSTENGGTWIVPKTHVDPRNPRGENDGIDEFAPIPNELQVEGPAGSVLVMDARIWHSNAENPDDKPRTAVVVRYAPWWLSLELFGVNQATLQAEVFDAFPEDVQMLYEHRIEGRESTIWA